MGKKRLLETRVKWLVLAGDQGVRREEEGREYYWRP